MSTHSDNINMTEGYTVLPDIDWSTLAAKYEGTIISKIAANPNIAWNWSALVEQYDE